MKLSYMHQELAEIMGHLNYRGHREYVQAIKSLCQLSKTPEVEKCAMKLHMFKNFIKVAEVELFNKIDIYSDAPSKIFLKAYIRLLRLKGAVRSAVFSYKQKPEKGGDFIIRGFDLIEEDVYISESRDLINKKLKLELIAIEFFEK